MTFHSRFYTLVLCVLGFFSTHAHAKPSDQTQTILVSDPYEALGLRLDLFDGVQGPGHEVLISVYSFKQNLGGLIFLAELMHTAQSGARVVLLVDHQRSKISDAYYAALTQAGVEVYLYNPFILRWPMTYNQRLHDKVWVFDRQKGLLTDRNISSMYFGIESDLDHETKHLPQSRDVYVEDSQLASDFAQHIEEQLSSGRVRRFNPTAVNPIEIDAAREALERQYMQRALLKRAAPYFWRSGLVATQRPEFLRDPGHHKGENSSIQRLLRDFAEAKESILIESAYVVPTPETIAALAEARTRNVDVQVFSSHQNSIDNGLVAQAWHASKGELIRLGIEVVETGEFAILNGFVRIPRVHSKAYVIDRRVAHIGSPNLDGRSHHINSETSLRFDSPTFATIVDNEIRKSMTSYGVVTGKSGRWLVQYPQRRCSTLVSLVAKYLPHQL